ncbi:hypothetical protein B9D94_22615 [Paenibacillus sp. Cedars]|nr:hypothetical protein B9D94_22615 [Paenibacillus sp. Cedars]
MKHSRLIRDACNDKKQAVKGRDTCGQSVFLWLLLVFLMGGLILFKQLQYILNTLCNRLQLKLTLPGMGNRGRFL